MKKNYFWPRFLRSSQQYSLMVLLAGALFQSTQAQQTYTFTTAGATGRNGPSQTQVSTAYNLTNLSGAVTVNTLGIQQWTVPTSGLYRIETYGAQGGSAGGTGGLGAKMSGDFNLTSGTVLKIVVGQAGGNGIDQGGGGGGSFVTDNSNTPLCIAGGGGGSYDLNYNYLAANMTATTALNGQDGSYAYNSTTSGLGGTNGSGGGSNVWYPGDGQGSGGGGLTGDGVNGGTATNAAGKAFINNAVGGQAAGNTTNAGSGGFGGGGGSEYAIWQGAGGGGGYSGGGGGIFFGCGGGGGSFNNGTNQNNTSGINTGDGKVIIQELCNISLVATGTDSNNAICIGQTVTLTTNAISNYSWSEGSTTSSIVVSPTVTTHYSLTAMSVSLCTTSAAITISVDPGLPTLTVVNTASASGGICPNSTVMLTASGATSYSWSGGSTAVTNGVLFGPTSPAEYTVTGYNACGTASAVTSISVHPFPSVTPVASSSSLCSGSSVTLTGVGDATLYAWSGGAGSISDGVGFSPALTATYTVIGTSALSCTASATIPVTVVSTPSLAPTAQPALICIGGSSTLTATGAANYTWTSSSATGNNSVFIVTPPSPGVTTYTIVRANSVCSTTQQISVVTNSLPTLFAIASPTLVCALNPATLAVGGGQTYTWTSPGNPPSIPSFTFNGPSPTVYPPVPTTYTVAASDGTCVNTTTVGLAVDPNPTITTIPTSSMICQGGSVSISANGGINYTWTATSGTFFTTSITDNPTVSTAYNVFGDNSYGCITQASQIVIVNPNPTLTAVASKTLVCSGGPSTLTAGGANTYVWDNSAITNTTIVNPANTTTGPVVFSVTGTYTSTTCHSTKTVQVTVFVPTITVSGSTNTCEGGNINLTASGGTGNNYTWYVPGKAPYSFATINTTLSAPAVFTVTALTTSLTVSCPGTKTLDVGIYTNPLITAVPERTAICTKESVVLTASGGDSYTWSNSQTGTTITVNPNSTAVYTVTGTDANGCMNTGTVQVKVLSCAGINEQSALNNALSIYPNPNNGEFAVHANTDLNLALINELGQTIRTITLSAANNYNVSVTDLAKGVYFITGKKDNTSINQKIVVTK